VGESDLASPLLLASTLASVYPVGFFHAQTVTNEACMHSWNRTRVPRDSGGVALIGQLSIGVLGWLEWLCTLHELA
jgi:hypothetical protein